MPAMHLDDQQARDVASYLLGRLGGRRYPPNLRYKVYEGTWSMLPNFDTLEPISQGESAGLDLSVAGRNDHFGMRFEGFLRIVEAGRYRFYLGSDDGSRLLINGNVAVDADGIHPHTTVTGRIELEAGIHPVRIDYFEQGGQESLTLEYEGPGIARQDLSMQLWMTPEGNPQPTDEDQDVVRFTPDPRLIETGRQLFATLGCASCHQLKRDGQAVASQPKFKPLAELKTKGGCLANGPSSVGTTRPPIPNFTLSPVQRVSLETALAEGLAAKTTHEKKPAGEIHDRMVALNCYACHRRGEVGGPENDRNGLFRTSIPEMGDEGRIPPPLDGVGDKLNDAWLAQVLADGANDRPYMRTRMPKFGKSNVGELASAFVSVDRRTEATIPQFDEPDVRVKSAGRELVGDQALACVKCHTFGKIRATGIQAIDLQTMTRRLREDWFLRYLYNPPEYRPGTRMPTGFPNGQAIVRDIYHGDPTQQIEAIWTYLSDGPKAGIPDGMLFAAIELKPTDRPLIYRNFLDGLSPRGIAVGYPEKANLAWDATELCLKRVWHGKFIDASTHWAGRGQGFQPPLGDHILDVEETVPIAPLSSKDEPWPANGPQERGYQFRGYQLNKAGQPTFLYDIPGGDVRDRFTPQTSAKDEGTFTRRLSVSAADSTTNLYFRAAAGRTLTSQEDGSYLVDGVLRVRVTGGTPFVRELNGRQELLVPLLFKNGQTEITQELLW